MTHETLFPTSCKEVFALLTAGGRELKHVFRPLTAEDWIGYEQADPPVRVRRGAAIHVESSGGEAAVKLWADTIQRVKGYGDGAPPTDWQDLIPLAHKVAALTALAQVEALDVEGAAGWGTDQQVTIRLEAARNGKRYELTHTLRRPTNAEEIGYNRSRGEAIEIEVRGAGPKAERRTTELTRLPQRLALWDKLFVQAHGYEYCTAKAVDPLHKRAAIEALMEGELGNVEPPALLRGATPKETPEAPRSAGIQG